MTLIDQFQRKHTYLRISVTDRCNFKCVYCLPEEGIEWQPKKDILQYEEIAYLSHIFCREGITGIRITGGEPTLRSDICSLIHALSVTDGLEDLSMTTNAHLLHKLAVPLKEAGLKRINISIDSLRPERFKKLTRGGDLSIVIKGIEKAIQVGLKPIKLNVVVLKGQNEDEILDFVHFSARYPDVQVRFIEYMPFEARWHQCFSSTEIKKIISTSYTLSPIQKGIGQGPSNDFWIEDLNTFVGFISPLSNKFCQSCNRLRLMADGHLRTCLSKEKHPSLRGIIRGAHTEEELVQTIRNIVWNKIEGHECSVENGTPFEGIMTRIGG
jgi:GTP 3',8-cyclase